MVCQLGMFLTVRNERIPSSLGSNVETHPKVEAQRRLEAGLHKQLQLSNERPSILNETRLDQTYISLDY